MGRRQSGWDLEKSRHTNIKMQPKPKKLVFTPEAQPQKQERLREGPSFEQLQRQEMQCYSEWKVGQREKQEKIEEQKKKDLAFRRLGGK